MMRSFFVQVSVPISVVMKKLQEYALADSVSRVKEVVPKRMALIGWTWTHPPVGWVRLNTDGSCRDGVTIDSILKTNEINSESRRNSPMVASRLQGSRSHHREPRLHRDKLERRVRTRRRL
ncbi:hypothetical protein A2U01_0021815, partial [Trifolium medium]|nr:hypothetical protein [Trifolium medium]